LVIIEMRTYQLKPGTLSTFEDRFGRALPVRQKFSQLAAFWHTEVGSLNEIIHVWPYDTFEQRLRVRADALTAEGWPPDTSALIADMRSEILLPAPFSPPLMPRKLGSIYEIRYCTYAAGTIPGVIQAWSEKIEARAKVSPFVGGWFSEVGQLNRWVHIWAYADTNERARIRTEVVRNGIWPPHSPPGTLLAQECKFVSPAVFSPLC
jgi:hypothetical protein